MKIQVVIAIEGECDVPVTLEIADWFDVLDLLTMRNLAQAKIFKYNPLTHRPFDVFTDNARRQWITSSEI